VRTFLCRAFVAELRTLAGAFGLVEVPGSDNGLWDAFLPRCPERCGVRTFRSDAVRVHTFNIAMYLFLYLDFEITAAARSIPRLAPDCAS